MFARAVLVAHLPRLELNTHRTENENFEGHSRKNPSGLPRTNCRPCPRRGPDPALPPRALARPLPSCGPCHRQRAAEHHLLGGGTGPGPRRRGAQGSSVTPSLFNLPRVHMRVPRQAGGPSEEAGWGAPPQGEAEDTASAPGPRGRSRGAPGSPPTHALQDAASEWCYAAAFVLTGYSSLRKQTVPPLPVGVRTRTPGDA